ncbi:MAG: hypothetical protein JWR21_979 [Herminiimonas sp.]|nr:hypothetical protein [Herminiimonas sp.]MDB5852367.1 hypothetical protein [Herminiimonas sp.]
MQLGGSVLKTVGLVRPAGEHCAVQLAGCVLKAVGMRWRRLALRDGANALSTWPGAMLLPKLRRARLSAFISDVMREGHRTRDQHECQ